MGKYSSKKTGKKNEVQEMKTNRLLTQLHKFKNRTTLVHCELDQYIVQADNNVTNLDDKYSTRTHIFKGSTNIATHSTNYKHN